MRISTHEKNAAILFVSVVILTGCINVPSRGPAIFPILFSQPLSVDSRLCTNTFVAHRLPHTTRSDKNHPSYQAHGAGVALANLNDDDLIDIVLAGNHAPSTILWNQANLRFRVESLIAKNSRAVNAVDVDGDSRVDLVFTHSGDRPSFWRASGSFVQPVFQRVPGDEFIGRFSPYAIAWADLDDDGDLDMVGASYNVELTVLGLGVPMGGGVFYYSNSGGTLNPLLLTPHSQALAILLTDLDDDGRRDILVGNDFATQDVVFLNKPEGWIQNFSFERTTANTMGFAEGDTDNNGSFEIMATDMKPYQTDPVWNPRLEGKGTIQPDDGVQFATNTLQFRTKGTLSGYRDRGEERGVDATGWSWSVQFGDLDNDGAVDLYVVNGMVHSGFFEYLPGHELVEENQAFRNDGRGYFIPAPKWGLGVTEGGRGMSFADLDNDGDLDIVVNNIEKPSFLFENQLYGGTALEVELHWEGSPNQHAIGAQLQLQTTEGNYYREVRLSSGYLSSLPARVHFGLGKATAKDLQHLDVIWPDGRVSQIDSPPIGTLLQIRRPQAQ